jgi:hypothetical protein
MFTQAICLTHYSDEFIARLEMIGYVKSVFSTSRHATRDDFCILTSVIQKSENPEYIVISKEEALSEDPGISWINKSAGRYVTDNEGLAFDLATLRDDDTDKYQIFVLDCNLDTMNENRFHPKGDLVFCTQDSWNVDFDNEGHPSILSSRNIPAHKATKEEIIKHFSKKN